MGYVTNPLPESRAGWRPQTRTNPSGAARMLGNVGDDTSVSIPNWGTFGTWVEIPGTGATIGDFLAAGYSADDISAMLDNTMGSTGVTQGPTPPLSPMPAVSTAGVPDGSLVTYVGQWMPSLTTSAPSVLAQVSSLLGGHGLNVVNGSENSGLVQLSAYTATLQIQVNTGIGGFAQPNDVASIVNNAVYQVTGKMPVSASITALQKPNASAPGGGILPAGSTGWGAWLQSNFGTIALLVVGVLVVPPLLKR